MARFPDGLVIEPAWLVEATYAPDAAETRVPFRAEHIAELARRKAAGDYIEGGAFADVSARSILVRAASEAEALAIVGDDVYLRNGVWVELRSDRSAAWRGPPGSRGAAEAIGSPLVASSIRSPATSSGERSTTTVWNRPGPGRRARVSADLRMLTLDDLGRHPAIPGARPPAPGRRPAAGRGRWRSLERRPSRRARGAAPAHGPAALVASTTGPARLRGAQSAADGGS